MRGECSSSSDGRSLGTRSTSELAELTEKIAKIEEEAKEAKEREERYRVQLELSLNNSVADTFSNMSSDGIATEVAFSDGSVTESSVTDSVDFSSGSVQPFVLQWCSLALV